MVNIQFTGKHLESLDRLAGRRKESREETVLVAMKLLQAVTDANLDEGLEPALVDVKTRKIDLIVGAT